MRRRWVLLIGLAAMSGCGEVAEPAPGESIMPTEAAPSPTSLVPGTLALFAPTGEIQVGTTADEADRLFPAPTSSFPLRELPAGFAEPYRARGYETYKEGFGVILYGDRVALAMRRQEDRSKDDADSIQAQYITRFGSPKAQINEGRMTYLFWYDGSSQRLMICVTPDSVIQTKFDLTVALGDTVVMDALRMNPINAYKDKDAGEKLLDLTKSKNPKR